MTEAEREERRALREMTGDEVRPKRKRKAAPVWTLPYGGRELYRNGVHVVTLTRPGDSVKGWSITPTELDELGRVIVAALNKAEGF